MATSRSLWVQQQSRPLSCRQGSDDVSSDELFAEVNVRKAPIGYWYSWEVRRGGLGRRGDRVAGWFGWSRTRESAEITCFKGTSALMMNDDELGVL